jgi:hypothetical protein
MSCSLAREVSLLKKPVLRVLDLVRLLLMTRTLTSESLGNPIKLFLVSYIAAL